MSNHSQQNTNLDNRFAQTDQEAESRFNNHKSNDPFPEILPALLNSADIEDYIAATGMICPFNSNELKPASYEVKLQGEVIYWDQKGKERSQFLNTNQSEK